MILAIQLLPPPRRRCRCSSRWAFLSVEHAALNASPECTALVAVHFGFNLAQTDRVGSVHAPIGFTRRLTFIVQSTVYHVSGHDTNCAQVTVTLEGAQTLDLKQMF